MTYILDNLWPILVATMASFAFGALYYGLLAKPWMAAAGLTVERIKAAGSATYASYAISFAAEFWIACILAGAIILAPPEAGPWTMAIGSAVVIWIGFVLPTILVNNRYGMRPFRLTVIDAGHWLGVFLVQVIVMQAWGLVAPAGRAAS